MVKSDIPIVGTPAAYAAIWTIIVIGYITVLATEPMSRPGVIECLVSVGFGLPAGLLFARSWVAFLRRIAEEVPRRPWLKWTAYLVYPTAPIGPQTSIRLLVMAVWGIGLAAIYLCLVCMRLIFPGISMPWMVVGTVSTSEDVMTAFGPYFLAWLAGLTVIGLRWYHSLDEQGGI